MDRLAQDLNFLVESGMRNISSIISEIPGGSIAYRYIASSYQNDPMRSVLEFLLVVFAIRYFLASKYSTTKKNYIKLSDKEIDELVSDWEPEPLVSKLEPGHADYMELMNIPVLSSPQGPYIELAQNPDSVVNLSNPSVKVAWEMDQITALPATKGPLINLAHADIYNLGEKPEFKESAIKSVRKYGVGSCGPAGFYGNQDAHDEAEEALAKFLGTEASILYSQGFAAVTSVIACFTKRGDVIVADKAVQLAIQKGILLSRATVLWYEHNDMEDLEKNLAKSVSFHRKGPLPRRFIITEAVFEHDGSICDLPKIIELKRKYKHRLMLDETWALGNLGATGRGLPEHLGIDRQENIEISMGSLASMFGAGGGFCAASAETIQHQRITSLAYTFSATMPAYLALMICDVTKYLDTEEFAKLHDSATAKATKLYDTLSACKNIKLSSMRGSPLIMFSCDKPGIESKVDLQRVINEQIIPEGIFVSRHKRAEEHEFFEVDELVVRMFVNSGISSKDMDKVGKVLVKTFS